MIRPRAYLGWRCRLWCGMQKEVVVDQEVGGSSKKTHSLHVPRHGIFLAEIPLRYVTRQLTSIQRVWWIYNTSFRTLKVITAGYSSWFVSSWKQTWDWEITFLLLNLFSNCLQLIPDSACLMYRSLLGIPARRLFYHQNSCQSERFRISPARKLRRIQWWMLLGSSRTFKHQWKLEDQVR